MDKAIDMYHKGIIKKMVLSGGKRESNKARRTYGNEVICNKKNGKQR